MAQETEAINESYLEKEKEDGKEFAEIVVKVPKERKEEALRLLDGFILGVQCRKEAI